MKEQRTWQKKKIFQFFFNRDFSILFECQNNRKRVKKSFANKEEKPMTPDTWQMTCDTWHVTQGGGQTFSQNFSSLALMIWA